MDGNWPLPGRLLPQKREEMSKLRKLEGGADYAFYCPGCKFYHWFRDIAAAGGKRPAWHFNGDMDRPTLSPSLLNRDPSSDRCCHLFVRDGKLQFLDDCTHEQAGQTVDMEDEQ